MRSSSLSDLQQQVDSHLPAMQAVHFRRGDLVRLALLVVHFDQCDALRPEVAAAALLLHDLGEYQSLPLLQGVLESPHAAIARPPSPAPAEAAVRNGPEALRDSEAEAVVLAACCLASSLMQPEPLPPALFSLLAGPLLPPEAIDALGLPSITDEATLLLVQHLGLLGANHFPREGPVSAFQWLPCELCRLNRYFNLKAHCCARRCSTSQDPRH